MVTKDRFGSGADSGVAVSDGVGVGLEVGVALVVRRSAGAWVGLDGDEREDALGVERRGSSVAQADVIAATAVTRTR